MRGLRDTLVGWIDERIKNMLATPRAFGSDEAIEMQTLLLLEMRSLTLRPEQEIDAPGRLVDAYTTYLAKAYPEKPNRPLCQIVESDHLGLKLAVELQKAVDVFTHHMLEENPFQHSDVAIRLTFEQGKVPTTSAFTGYYEEFRRAARAVARPRDKRTGRVTKAIEAATDFALNDARVTPRNGAPAEVLLLLGMSPGQRDHLAEQQVRDALSGLVEMGAWAGSSENVAHAPVDDPEQRTRVAVQALRILPRRGVASVSIGGLLIGRSRPVELRGEHQRRIVEVIGSTTRPEPFERHDVVRGIDLDRGLILLGRQDRLPCYVYPELLGDVAVAGIGVRVRGQLYRPVFGKPFVLAEAIEFDERPDED